MQPAPLQVTLPGLIPHDTSQSVAVVQSMTQFAPDRQTIVHVPLGHVRWHVASVLHTE